MPITSGVHGKGFAEIDEKARKTGKERDGSGKTGSYNVETMTLLAQSFVQALGIAAESVTDQLAYQSIPQWDSVGHMALVTELENAFNVTFDTDDIIDMSSVAKAKEILAKLGTNPDAPAA